MTAAHVDELTVGRPPDPDRAARLAVMRRVPTSPVEPATPAAAKHLVCVALELAVGVGAADLSSVTVLADNTSISSGQDGAGDVAAASDRLQLDLGEGPSLTAIRDQVMVAVPAIGIDARWPGWTTMAMGWGLSAMLAVPVPSTDASLNLYFRRARPLDDRLVAQARAIADQAGQLLQAARLEANLQRAVASRTVIGQAQGILIERYRITAAVAFQMLRTHSQNYNVKVATLAESLVETGEYPEIEWSAVARGRRR